jgi:hypothetical protein
MTCPLCGAPLQRLEGHDGYRVDVMINLSRSLIVEQPSVAVLLACPRCEFIRETNERPRVGQDRPRASRIQR